MLLTFTLSMYPRLHLYVQESTDVDYIPDNTTDTASNETTADAATDAPTPPKANATTPGTGGRAINPIGAPATPPPPTVGAAGIAAPGSLLVQFGLAAFSAYLLAALAR